MTSAFHTSNRRTQRQLSHAKQITKLIPLNICSAVHVGHKVEMNIISALCKLYVVIGAAQLESECQSQHIQITTLFALSINPIPFNLISKSIRRVR